MLLDDNEEPFIKKEKRSEQIKKQLQVLQNFYLPFLKSEKYLKQVIAKKASDPQFEEEVNIFKDTLEKYRNEKIIFENFSVNPNTEKDLFNKFKEIDSKNNEKITSVQKMMEQIVAIEDSIEENNNNNNEQHSDQEGAQSNSLIDGMFTQEVIDKGEFLKERREKLQNIKQVTATIKDMAQQMAIDVDAQGKVLNNIEDNIIVVSNNTDKAETEIEEANKENKENSKKTIYMLIIVIFVVIVGVGLDVNLDLSDFSDDLQGKITSLKVITGKEFDENDIIRTFLEEFEKICKLFIDGEYENVLNQWRKRSYTIGKIVEVRKPYNKTYDGYVTGINKEGALIVEKIDGTLEKVVSGECIIKN